MYKNFLNLTFILLAVFSLSAYAEIVEKANIPEKILDQLYKRHPDALDITAEQKKHFKQDLYGVYFKEGDSRKVEFYRANGNFFVSGTIAELSKNSDLLPLNTNANLTAEFTSYDIKKSVIIINPNGSGEEYDFVINSSGRDYDVSVDTKGKIFYKQAH